jgi:endonuclease V-like protein UPF0215 family
VTVALGELPVDGEGATEYVVSWIGGLRSRPALQTVILDERLVKATLAKSRLPEPLRLAHLIGQAIVLRESRGHV